MAEKGSGYIPPGFARKKVQIVKAWCRFKAGRKKKKTLSMQE